MAKVYPPTNVERPSGPVAAEQASPSEPSIAQLIANLLQDGQQLVQKELTLARREIMHEVDTVRQSVVSLMIGGGLLLMAGILLTFAIAHGAVALWNMPLWLGYLLVGMVFALAGSGIAYTASQRLKTVNPVPEETIDSVRKDIAWVQEQTSSDRT
jgi:Putative Actinobacterial Holin-X, holin superfamily III